MEQTDFGYKNTPKKLTGIRKMPYYHPCMASKHSGCGKYITWNFAICAKCEAIYGKRARDWPDWLRFLWQDEQKRRRRAKKEREREIVFSDLETEPDY